MLVQLFGTGAALAHAAPSFTVGQCQNTAFAHARTGALTHQTSLIPQPTEAGHMLCTKNSMRLPVLLLHIAGFDVALVRHSIFITYAP